MLGDDRYVGDGLAGRAQHLPLDLRQLCRGESVQLAIEGCDDLRPTLAPPLTRARDAAAARAQQGVRQGRAAALRLVVVHGVDRKSTRLNSSHVKISYAVFCLKKKTR